MRGKTRHIFLAKMKRSCIRYVKPCKTAQQRCLPTTTWTQQKVELTRFDLKGDSLKRSNRAKLLFDTRNGDSNHSATAKPTR